MDETHLDSSRHGGTGMTRQGGSSPGRGMDEGLVGARRAAGLSKLRWIRPATTCGWTACCAEEDEAAALAGKPEAFRTAGRQSRDERSSERSIWTAARCAVPLPCCLPCRGVD
jgi:hypothetical protein